MRLTISAVIVAVLVGSAAPAAAQCTKDVECKGTRVCHRGECVEAVPTSAARAPASTPARAPAPARPVALPEPASSELEVAAPAAVPVDAVPSPPESGTPMVTAPRPAAPDASSRFQVAFRTGYAHPSGSFTGAEGDSMGNAFSGQWPLIFDLGWKVSRHWFVGGYAGVGIGGPAGDMATSCANTSCVGVTFRLGLLAEYNILPHRSVNPWFGFGFGLEYASMYWSGRDGSGSAAGLGFEIASLMAGVDFKVSPGVGVGPFVSFSAGQYRQVSFDDYSGTTKQSIDNPAWHEWFMIGVRMVFRP